MVFFLNRELRTVKMSEAQICQDRPCTNTLILKTPLRKAWKPCGGVKALNENETPLYPV